MDTVSITLNPRVDPTEDKLVEIKTTVDADYSVDSTVTVDADCPKPVVVTSDTLPDSVLEQIKTTTVFILNRH